MTRSQMTITPIDSGQLQALNRKNSQNNLEPKLEVLNSSKNQGRTMKSNVCTDIEQNHEIASMRKNGLKDGHSVSFNDSDTIIWDNTTSNHQQMIESLTDLVDKDLESPNDNKIDETNINQETNNQDHQFIGANFRMEINAQSNPTEESVIKTMYSKVSELIQRWFNNREIIGIELKDGTVIKEGVNQRAQEWATDYRVIYKKKVIYEETYLKLKSPFKVIQLHSSVKDLCSKYHIKLETKHMMKGFTKRIGFLVGPYVNAASPEFYIKQLGLKNDQFDRSVEIRKQMTYERGVRSKVLVVHGIEQEADKIDMKIMSNQYEGFKYLSYKRSKAEERMAAIHYNDVINVKARYEILFGAKVDDIVQYNGKTTKLKRLLLDLNDKGEKLILAVEQGSGVAKNNIQVILNPQIKEKAKQWLVNEYSSVLFKYQSENKTTVNAEDVSKRSQYSEDLKAFLSPVLEHKDATKVKKYGQRVKSYAQALGIKNKDNPKASNNHQKTKNNEKDKQKKAEEVVELKNTIKQLEDKIQKLLDMVTILTSTIEDERKRERIIESLQSIHENDSRSEINTKEDKDEERTSNEANEKEASSQNKDKEILGKRKQHTPTPTSGYNIEQQDLSGQICQYI